MKKTFNSACPLDCPDRCSFGVEVEDGNITRIFATDANPLTKGVICAKARHQLARQNSPDRVTRPLRRVGRSWQPITWPDAYDLIQKNLLENIEQYGPLSIMLLSGFGAEGLLQSFDQRFFNILGGVTRTSGCVCMGAGIKAQEYDFGEVYSHSWADLLNAKTIIIWGRDPLVTNYHLTPYIKECRAQGAKVVVINPLKVESTKLADYHLAPRPGTDGALAMAMAHVIMDTRRVDFNFVHQYVKGFKEYAERVKEWAPERAEQITGISAEEIKHLALLYADSKPASILLGFGLQRYKNGGQTIRAIGALAALTGNIGTPGGGVAYAHRYWKGLFSSLSGKEYIKSERFLPIAQLAAAIEDTKEPPIQAVFVSKTNPVTQLPNSNHLREAFRAIPFKVVIDFFLNDTAEEADLFLPVATIFEQEDIIYNSWNEYALYAEPVVPPRGEAKSELQIFTELAQHFGIADRFGVHSASEWLSTAISPLVEHGITLDTFKSAAVRCPAIKEVAWPDRHFLTPSGKYELYSELAEQQTGDPLPGFGRLGPLGDNDLALEYPLQLMTPHPKLSMHSSFFVPEMLPDQANHPVLTLHPTDARARYLASGDQAIIETTAGQLNTLVKVSDQVMPGVAVIDEGSWIKDGGGVNLLTAAVQSDMGGGTAYYDCRCQVRKYQIDSL